MRGVGKLLEEILISTGNHWKRRKLMVQSTGSASCPWKGKRAVAMALGHVDKMVQSIAEHSTANFQHILAVGTPNVAAAMQSLASNLKASLAHTLLLKFKFWSTIPYKAIR